MTYATAAEILTHAGVKTPTQDDTAWASAVAGAINAGIDVMLNGNIVETATPAFDELHAAALIAGGEAYKRREVPFGLTGYNDIEGSAIRLARDYLHGVKPIIERYSIPGIG